MAELGLDGADVGAAVQEMGAVGVPAFVGRVEGHLGLWA